MDSRAAPARSPIVRGHRTGDRFRHEALIYGDDYEFLAAAHPFVADALAGAEPVLVAVAAERARSLKGSLGGDAGEARFADMEALGRNPARLIPAWRRFLSEHAQDGRGVRILSEAAWPGRSPAELNECSRYESLLDLAFGQGQAWRLLCGYDARAVRPRSCGLRAGAWPSCARSSPAWRALRALAPSAARTCSWRSTSSRPTASPMAAAKAG